MNRDSISHRVQLFLKRVIDIVLSFLGLILFFPTMLVIALAIKCDSPGKVLYSHRRIGKDGCPFNLYKFRSMIIGANDAGYMQYLRKLIESEKSNKNTALPYRKMDSDPRVTRVGKIIRCFYLDELPQLFNILRGEMSLVGPRPHVQFEVDSYTSKQYRRLSIRPGLTGLWQTEAKAECTFSQLIQMDLDYIDHWSLWLDIRIIVKTIILMMLGGEKFWLRMTKYIPNKKIVDVSENEASIITRSDT
jgi:lipopolysaccharide/colanic/teichoic acid biosynthesis glycosyltransferase